MKPSDADALLHQNTYRTTSARKQMVFISPEMWLNETHLPMQSAHEIISISDRIMRDCGHTTLLQARLLMRRAYQTPPERIGVGLKHLVILLLSEIHQERGQDQTQEANVPGGDQFLLNTPSIHVNIKCLL